MFTIAACNYIFREVTGFDDFVDHVREVLDSADAADLIVLPELMTLELMTTFPGWESAELGLLADTRIFASKFEALMNDEAKSRRKFVVAGSHLTDTPQGIRNVSHLYGPSGLVSTHAKTHLFPVEFSLGTGEGDTLGVSDLPFVRAGTNICYEAEIPECAATVVEQGAELLIVPSLTFTEAGFWRVRHCVQARCIENQVFAAHAGAGGPARGPFPGSYAKSSILSPCDNPWPASGVLAEAVANEDSVAIAELNLDDLRQNRKTGAATTFMDRRRRADRYAAWPSHILTNI
ncbi:nitrilase-related carbon-nitrogen hydrolase [Paenarthrobacter sp. YJN-D]|uniref:nitrilase-related carbon-nitrogen hydrolase n=1 Tax=Paenarthrobacter sp. YJN-D TaxID=2735317 RepID=UPI0018784650|nr:nitrilase-related carbon-nitrogen hydrolase [Paenarthrobacter sp. YJN-D]QOT24043.1 amidohydrolase [Paenarthrobacter sp. YJN-D]